MAYIPGKSVVLVLDGHDISRYCASVEQGRKVDMIDATTFGQGGRVRRGSLTDGTLTTSGVYDSTAAGGPGTVVGARAGRTATLTYRPEGVGNGLPVQTWTVLVASYQETAAMFDMVKWTAEFQICSDPFDSDFALTF